MAEVWICWLLLALARGRRALRLRKPAHAKRRGALSVDAVKDSLYAETVHEIVEEYRTGEIPRIVDDVVEWDVELGVATAQGRYASEVAPICAQLTEPSPMVEFNGEQVSIDELCSFTLGWRRKPGGGFEVVDYAGAAK